MPGPEVGLLSLRRCISAGGAAMHLGAGGDVQALLPSCCSNDPGFVWGTPEVWEHSVAHPTPSWDAAAKSLRADEGQACFSLVKGALGQMVCLSLVLLS